MLFISRLHKEIASIIQEKYDMCDIPTVDTKLPFIRLDNLDITDINITKEFKTYKLSQQIHIWSNYNGKKEIVDIIENIYEDLLEINDMYDDFNLYEISISNIQILNIDEYKQGILSFDCIIEVY